MSRVLLITGATGIAEATAIAASAQGDAVFVVSRTEETCRDLCRLLRNADYCVCDLREEREVDAAFDACLRKIPRCGCRVSTSPASADANSETVPCTSARGRLGCHV